jgi:hypothetical protein
MRESVRRLDQIGGHKRRDRGGIFRQALEHRSADINALVGESLNRSSRCTATRIGFNITLNHGLVTEAGAVCAETEPVYLQSSSLPWLVATAPPMAKNPE